MDGLEYLTDENGVKKALVIPINKYRCYIEDIEDMLVAVDRKDEPRISLEEIEEKYNKRKDNEV